MADINVSMNGVAQPSQPVMSHSSHVSPHFPGHSHLVLSHWKTKRETRERRDERNVLHDVLLLAVTWVFLSRHTNFLPVNTIISLHYLYLSSPGQDLVPNFHPLLDLEPVFPFVKVME